MRAHHLALGSVLLLVACGETSLRGEGESCVRSVQCAPGLGCINNVCGTDTTLLEGGMAVEMDAGMMMDAMVLDGMVMDAGDVDGGPMVDAGDVDGGPPGVDGGPGVDSGPPMMDAGPPMMDAGPPMMDSGPPMMDAGPPPPTDAG